MTQGAGMLSVLGEFVGLVAPFVGFLIGGYAVLALINAVKRGSDV